MRRGRGRWFYVSSLFGIFEVPLRAWRVMYRRSLLRVMMDVGVKIDSLKK